MNKEELDKYMFYTNAYNETQPLSNQAPSQTPIQPSIQPRESQSTDTVSPNVSPTMSPWSVKPSLTSSHKKVSRSVVPLTPQIGLVKKGQQVTAATASSVMSGGTNILPRPPLQSKLPIVSKMTASSSLSSLPSSSTIPSSSLPSALPSPLPSVVMSKTAMASYWPKIPTMGLEQRMKGTSSTGTMSRGTQSQPLEELTSNKPVESEVGINRTIWPKMSEGMSLLPVSSQPVHSHQTCLSYPWLSSAQSMHMSNPMSGNPQAMSAQAMSQAHSQAMSPFQSLFPDYERLQFSSIAKQSTGHGQPVGQTTGQLQSTGQSTGGMSSSYPLPRWYPNYPYPSSEQNMPNFLLEAFPPMQQPKEFMQVSQPVHSQVSVKVGQGVVRGQGVKRSEEYHDVEYSLNDSSPNLKLSHESFPIDNQSPNSSAGARPLSSSTSSSASGSASSSASSSTSSDSDHDSDRDDTNAKDDSFSLNVDNSSVLQRVSETVGRTRESQSDRQSDRQSGTASRGVNMHSTQYSPQYSPPPFNQEAIQTLKTDVVQEQST